MNRQDNTTVRKSLWNFIDRIEGDKVVWVIVFMLLIISWLAIFSSTPLLALELKTDRLSIMKDQIWVTGLGLGIIIGLYHIRKIGILKWFSQLGFFLSFGLLLILDSHKDLGFIYAEEINEAWRTLNLFGFQLHVFEVVKIAMIMYLAWAMNAVKEDLSGAKKGSLKIAEKMAGWHKKLAFLNRPFGKRAIYIYAPTMIISLMIFAGSGSSAIFICAILVAAMLLGDVPVKELLLAGVVIFIGFFSLVTIYKLSEGKVMKRVGTMISRMNADYDINRLEGLEGDDYHNMVDTLSQPVSAKIAVHEGGLLGKGIGNSTQKYRVQNIYGDYMYSFIIEEYGLLGGLGILILYVSLLARSSIIARMCSDDFAKYVLGGLAILISGQAFMHIFVNVGIGPMTGETLPLISHGASAFLVFCIAFGIILSISRMAKKKIQTVEDMTAEDKNALQENIDIAAKSKE